MTGRERSVERQRDERLRLGVAQGRTGTVDERLHRKGRPVRQRDGYDGQQQDAPAAVDRAENSREHDPEQPEPAGVGQPFEHRIQPTRAMVDDPALEVAVGGDQAGTICFVCSISARRSNGLPTKPWAPRSAASRLTSS